MTGSKTAASADRQPRARRRGTVGWGGAAWAVAAWSLVVGLGCAHGGEPFATDRVGEPTDAVYASFATGEAHGCGVRTDGTLHCWGRDDVGQASAPAGEDWEEVTVGALHSCARTRGGRVRCWGAGGSESTGAFAFGQADPPGETFRAIAAGAFHTCGIVADGTFRCWGLETYGATDAPEGTFRAVEAGRDHTCALESGGGLVCWGLGRGSWRPLRDVEELGELTSFAAIEDSVCAVGGDQRIYCEDAGDGKALPTPTGRFVAVCGGGDTRCGRRPDGAVACWRSGSSRAREFRGPFVELQAGSGFACGRTDGGRLLCRGGDDGGAADPAGTGNAERKTGKSGGPEEVSWPGRGADGRRTGGS